MSSDAWVRWLILVLKLVHPHTVWTKQTVPFKLIDFKDASSRMSQPKVRVSLYLNLAATAEQVQRPHVSIAEDVETYEDSLNHAKV